MKVTDKDEDQKTPAGKKRLGDRNVYSRFQLSSSAAGGRWRRQHRTELDGEKLPVAYVPPKATRRK